MGYEAVSLSIVEHTTDVYAYETIETIESIGARVHSITTSGRDQLALVTIMLGFESEGKTGGDRPLFTGANASTIYLLDSLRPLVRKTDVVFLLDHTCYFLLPGANLQGGQIVQSRLWDALLWRIHNASDGEILHLCSILSGYSAHPAPYRD